MNQAKMRIGQAYNEEEGTWNVDIGDIVFWDDGLWIITRMGTTTFHEHQYINLLTYRKFWGRTMVRIYSWEAKQIKQYWKIEKTK